MVAVNDRACRLFDCRKDAVLGEPLADISLVLADLAPSEDRLDVETEGRVLAVSVSPVTDARDRQQGWAFVVRDVTVDRRRQQRLDVLSRVFRHTIRNTMNMVVGPTAVLTERLEGGDAETAETALSAGETVVALSEKVRAVERMMTGTVEPATVSVAEFLENTVRSVRDETPFTVDLDVPSDCRVRTDASVLSVVFENALETAAVHGITDDAARPTDGVDTNRPSGTDGGDTGWTADHGPRVRITVEDRDSGCLVHVSDDGPGIPPTELDILRSGAETELQHASGVGLWAIHWGMSRLDGAVRFADSDRGTRVTLWVPDLDDGPITPPPTDVADGNGGEWFGRTPDGRGVTDGHSAEESSADESPADGPAA